MVNCSFWCVLHNPENKIIDSEGNKNNNKKPEKAFLQLVSQKTWNRKSRREHLDI